MEKRVYQKKIQGFPQVFTFEISKTALKCDLKQWSSSHRHRYRRHRHRYRRSRSKHENKNVGHGKLKD
jgi:hypothetical protein